MGHQVRASQEHPGATIGQTLQSALHKATASQHSLPTTFAAAKSDIRGALCPYFFFGFFFLLSRRYADSVFGNLVWFCPIPSMFPVPAPHCHPPRAPTRPMLILLRDLHLFRTFLYTAGSTVFQCHSLDFIEPFLIAPMRHNEHRLRLVLANFFNHFCHSAEGRIAPQHWLIAP